MQKSQVECEQPSEEQSHEEDMPQSWPSFMHRAQQSPHCDGDADWPAEGRSFPRMCSRGLALCRAIAFCRAIPCGGLRPVKRHRGEPGHTRDTRTHKGTRTTQTNLTTIQTHQQRATPQPARPRDDRGRGRLKSRRPGVDRPPRPTQKRPPPANPTLPPPAPRAPPRACSKAVGEMKARAADA
jgi:hypothetical protein